MSLVGFCKKVTELLVSDYNSVAKSHHLLHCLIVAIRVKAVNVVFALNEGIVYIFLCKVEVVLSTVKMLGVEDMLFVMPENDDIGFAFVCHEESGLFSVLSDDSTLAVCGE